MHRAGSGDRARELEERLYQRTIQAFREGRLVIYSLRSAWQTPCALGEFHEVNGAWQSAMLVYGPWDTGQEHTRITTWRDLPGQEFHPDALPLTQASPPQDIQVRIDDRLTPATLRRDPETWELWTAIDEHKILLTGRGPLGDLTLAKLDDIVPVIAARRTRIENRRR
ncbi:hypothetical protein P2Q00_36040 [Streptomyces coacervatus]|nr:hypothetical protein [Streptomyces coacervatus]MDF2270802.1 hypothetical protein [Streptomyces coacervatus]